MYSGDDITDTAGGQGLKGNIPISQRNEKLQGSRNGSVVPATNPDDLSSINLRTHSGEEEDYLPKSCPLRSA